MFEKKGLIKQAEIRLKEFEKENAQVPKHNLVGSARWQNLNNEITLQKNELIKYENHLKHLQTEYKDDMKIQIEKFKNKIKGFEFKINNELSFFVNKVKGYTFEIEEIENDIVSIEDQTKKTLLEFDKLQKEAEKHNIILQEYPKIKKLITGHEAEITENNRRIKVIKDSYKEGLLDTAFHIEEISGKKINIKNELQEAELL